MLGDHAPRLDRKINVVGRESTSVHAGQLRAVIRK